MMTEFKELDVELIGLSTASIYSHIAWIRKCKELVWKDMKHVDINFPLIADVSMEIAAQYAMQHKNASGTQTVRAVFIIDPESKIRAILYYPFTIGRSIQEIRRIVIALQKTDREQAEAPADWMPGDDLILPPPKTCDAADNRIDRVNENMYCLDWFLAFRQSDSTTDEEAREPEINPYPSVAPIKQRRMNSKNRRKLI
jgi:peroxiredoxin (alkyl hydroperoxide reductase subunit C)